MRKIDTTVKKETLYITVCTVILSALMEAVFLIVRKWDYTVLTGNLLGGTAAVVNFFLMGLTVQKAVGQDAEQAKQTVRLSQTLRLIGLLVVAVIGVAVPVFHYLAVLIPLFFPRVGILFRPLLDRKQNRERS